MDGCALNSRAAFAAPHAYIFSIPPLHAAIHVVPPEASGFASFAVIEAAGGTLKVAQRVTESKEHTG